MTTSPSSLMQAMAVHAEPGSLLGVDVPTEQLDLLRDPETGKLPADVFRTMRKRADGRAPGRPPGAKNKKSDALGKLIVQKFGDPVLGMAAIYAMPLDQLVELLLVADGSKDREDRLLELAEQTQDFVSRLERQSVERGASLSDKKIEKLTELVERVQDLAKVLKTKPGELALKALNTQLAARREVAMFVHSKMPIAVDHNVRADVILNVPGLTDPAHLAEYVDNAELTDQDIAGLEYVPFEPVADAGSGDDPDGATE